MGKTRIIAVALIGVLFFSSLVFALSGPFKYEGGTFYVVNSANQSENTGTKVCALVGLKCVGYTDLDTAVCRLAHRGANAIFSPTESGVKTGFYCNGAPQQGECSDKPNTCDVCPQCDLGVDCNSTFDSLYAELFVQCAADPSNATLKPLFQLPAASPGVVQPIAPQPGLFSGFLSFFSNLASGFSSFFSGLFGGNASPAPQQPSSSGAPAAGGSLCPLSCFKEYAGQGAGSPAAVNCNVNSAAVHQPLSACPGTTSDVGSGSSPCSCNPVETVSQACPVTCAGQDTCVVNPGIAGATNLPCDGTIQGSSQSCKCVLRNGQWDLGAKYGVN